MKEDQIHEICEYIVGMDNDELSDLTIEKIAKEFNISYSYLSRSFLKAKKVKLSDFIVRVKLSNSFHLLYLYPDLKISEIARMVGFDSNEYFRKVFKRYTDITPSRFRDLKR